jgi:biopolymer transport protein ExbD
VLVSTESKDKVENLLLTVTTSDANGRSAGEAGFEGANLGGECRIYINNTTPVDSVELRDQAFKRLDNLVKRAGGPEALKDNPDLIPQVHIRGDVNAPWRCIAGAIYNVQISGYPTVGFISNPVEPGI